jgi:hypothetical protein
MHAGLDAVHAELGQLVGEGPEDDLAASTVDRSR